MKHAEVDVMVKVTGKEDYIVTLLVDEDCVKKVEKIDYIHQCPGAETFDLYKVDGKCIKSGSKSIPAYLYGKYMCSMKRLPGTDYTDFTRDAYGGAEAIAVYMEAKKLRIKKKALVAKKPVKKKLVAKKKFVSTAVVPTDKISVTLANGTAISGTPEELRLLLGLKK